MLKEFKHTETKDLAEAIKRLDDFYCAISGHIVGHKTAILDFVSAMEYLNKKQNAIEKIEQETKSK